VRGVTTFFLRSSLLASVVLLLAACGGVGDSTTHFGAPSDAAHAPLTLRTMALPAGHVGKAYPTTRIPVEGASAPITFRLWSGSLPPGLRLGADGSIAGTPTAAGTYAFELRAAAAADGANASFVIAVDAFGLAAEGLRFGDAWTGEEVRLVAAGRRAPVAFAVVDNRSGGRFGVEDGAAGRATWVPGPRGGVSDLLRATETGAAGRTATLRVAVMPHPALGHRAEFGSTDVWYVSFELRHGAHAHPTDFDAALARLGLRHPASAGSAGTVAEQLASLYVRREVLRELGRLFRRDAGGLGLAISFPLEQPGPAFARPPEGLALQAGPGIYNVLGIADARDAGGSGMAFQDRATNELIENNSPSEANGDMGVFVGRVSDLFAEIHDDAYDLAGLAARPVGPSDEAALRALVYGLPSPGGRFDLLRDVGAAFGRELGRYCAHEIGHSVGLLHTTPNRPGSVMNAGLLSGAGAVAFLPEDLDLLERALPGTGRGGAPRAKPVLAVPDGGCEHCGAR
jgi:hypothetical protein